MKEFINKIICANNLDILKKLPDNSIDLILIDPPYNIKKADWDDIENYIEWMGERFIQSERILKDTGSFYWFHNDFDQMSDLQHWIKNNTKFVFKSLITIEKEEGEYIKDLYGKREHFRNYINNAEYCCFYTFYGDDELNNIKRNLNNFKGLRDYFSDLHDYIGLTKKDIIRKVGYRADHCFRPRSKQWELPTKKTYEILIDVFNLNEWNKLRDYDSLKEEHCALRKEYENKRYVFNKKEGQSNVWKYKFKGENRGSFAPKPLPLIEDIIKNSSNEGDIVLDYFAGYCTVAEGCIRTGRKFINIEEIREHCNIGERRVEKYN